MNFRRIRRGLFLFFIFFAFCLPVAVLLQTEVQKNTNIHESSTRKDSGENEKNSRGPVEVRNSPPNTKADKLPSAIKVKPGDGSKGGDAEKGKILDGGTDQPGNVANVQDIKRASTERFPIKLVVEDGHEWIKGPVEDYLVLCLETPFLAGQDIKGLQQVLQKLQFYQGQIDGVYGPETEEAVEEFQIHHGLKPTGVVDLDDYKLIAECYEETRSAALQTRPAGKVSLLVILDERTLYVLDDGKYFAKFPVAIGTPLTPTPMGHWTIVSKDSWGEGFGTRWMGLNVPYGRFGIHGTNKPWTISGMESHGCVRMLNQDIEVLYDWVKHGTKVDIVGGQFPYNLPWRDLQDGDRGSDVWQLQCRLKELGYLSSAPDGVFGGYTKKALCKFQGDHQLEVTGYVNPATLHALGFDLFQ